MSDDAIIMLIQSFGLLFFISIMKLTIEGKLFSFTSNKYEKDTQLSNDVHHIDIKDTLDDEGILVVNCQYCGAPFDYDDVIDIPLNRTIVCEYCTHTNIIDDNYI